MSFKARKIIHRIWLLGLFSLVVFYFLKTGTIGSSVSFSVIQHHGQTGEPLSIGASLLIWFFELFAFGILISGIVYLFEMIFFAILFRSEVIKKHHFRRAALPEYSKRAEIEQIKGFIISFVIGFGSVLLLIIFQMLGLYQR